MDWNQEQIQASLSIGVATHAGEEDVDLFMRRADRAMHSAKREAGRRLAPTLAG
ncbi:hypothetical protein [Synechococcus sp. CS-1328]|uniref:hypothetical protein n=1 Tax=Synechococcus sp. CS-1328 TaxID=2847976 RepID=UPI00223A71B5|nr:hypothetical protein [Synechococcus sp. CS-1328]MCT0224766.1 diguanylate cyclase [Synechococcus sp. CS-1328]